jgi:hypothetical protein
MCQRELAAGSEVSVREMGLPANETLVSGSFFAPQWAVAVGYGVSSLIDYFEGDNALHSKFPSARTTPVTFRQKHYPNGTVYEWTSSMMVSTAAFPDPSALPAPVDPLRLEPVGSRLVAVRQFFTVDLPSQLEVATLCDEINAGTVPHGYAIVEDSPWSPTYAIYSGKDSQLYASECWKEVVVA